MSYSFNPFTANLDDIGAGGDVGGSDTQIQFNDGGVFGGFGAYDKNTGSVTFGAQASAAATELDGFILSSYNTSTTARSSAVGLTVTAVTTTIDSQTSAIGSYSLASTAFASVGTGGQVIGAKGEALSQGSQWALTYGGYFNATSIASGTARGIYAAASGTGTNYAAEFNGNVWLDTNNNLLYFGASKIAAISSDGTDLILNPRVSGSGDVLLKGDVTIGAGASGVDYELKFNGETSTGSLFYMEDEGILNLRIQGASYFDYNAPGGSPQEQSGLTIDTIYDTTKQNVTTGFASWIKHAQNSLTSYSFFGGGYDEGSSGATGSTYYGAVGYNYFTATNSRTIALMVAVQGLNDTALAQNLTVTEALGGDFQTPYSGSGTGGSAARVVGLRAGGSGGTVNWAAIFSADVQMQTTSKFILGGSGTAKGINWFVRGATTTNVLLAINSANEYDWRAASFAPVSGATAKSLGLGTTQGWGSLFLQDTSASFTNQILSTSSTALTANRVLTVDMVNASRTLKLQTSSAYTPTNVTTDRSFDANSTTLDEIADVLGTLIADLQNSPLIG